MDITILAARGGDMRGKTELPEAAKQLANISPAYVRVKKRKTRPEPAVTDSRQGRRAVAISNKQAGSAACSAAFSFQWRALRSGVCSQSPVHLRTGKLNLSKTSGGLNRKIRIIAKTGSKFII